MRIKDDERKKREELRYRKFVKGRGKQNNVLTKH